MSLVYLIGAGTGSTQMLTLAAHEAIQTCDLLIGASRLLEPYADLPCEQKALIQTADIVDALLTSSYETACVLFSGDVGFYSGASLVLERIQSRDASLRIEVIPGISSIQYFCAKIGQRWDNVRLISAHGRKSNIARELRQHGKVLMLTGGATKAHDICEQLVVAGYGEALVRVGERLSYPDERIVQQSASKLAKESFSDLAVMFVDGAHLSVSCEGELSQSAQAQLSQSSQSAQAQPPQSSKLPQLAEPVQMYLPPRILISAPRSGSGKTTFTCGLLRALQRRGIRPMACKCGPDYIDPLFHRAVLSVPSRNIDLFFMTEDQAQDVLCRNAEQCDIAVIEGAMGYFDGIATSDEASAWHVAHATNTPCILLVDAKGAARSIAAEVLGFALLRASSHIAGVVLNRVSAAFYPQLKEVIEQETDIPVLGFMPSLPQATFASRHLGLVTADELADIQDRIDAIADALEAQVDIDALLEVAGYDVAHMFSLTMAGAHVTSSASAPEIAPDPASAPDPAPTSAAHKPHPRSENAVQRPLIAIARDEAFCFYYEESYDALKRAGADIVEFSPLHDSLLPPHISGLYIGGGYPELYAQSLSENAEMRAALHAQIQAGLPTIAECGGFLYLHEALCDASEQAWPMVGAIAGQAAHSGKLSRFGYVTLEASTSSLLAETGDTLRAHEFHYWESSNPGSAFVARKPRSQRSWECCHVSPTLYAGFPHVYLPSSQKAVSRFVDACAAFARRSLKGDAS